MLAKGENTPRGDRRRRLQASLLATLLSTLLSTSAAFLIQHRVPLLNAESRRLVHPTPTSSGLRSRGVLLDRRDGLKSSRILLNVQGRRRKGCDWSASAAASNNVFVQSEKLTQLPGMDRVLFVETGFGADQHGQNITKAAVRACRNAIEFNSIPSIASLLPGGYADMVLRVSLALPLRYAGDLDLEQVRQVFPYGRVIFNLQEGGCCLGSGIALAKMGDVGDDMLLVAAHIAVGSSSDAALPEVEAEQPREDSYADLAHYVRQLHDKAEGKQTWIALVGPPGSGKSTVADRLVEKMSSEGLKAVAVPMDGYHYYRSELEAMPNAALFQARRGAHWTFNASKLLADLTSARARGEGVFPSFDHAVGDPLEGEVTLSAGAEVVVVEGLYLALQEAAPWRQLRGLFDATWFIDQDEQILRERVIKRNSQAWGLDRATTAARVDANDVPNMRLVQASRAFADRVLRLPSDGPELVEEGASEGGEAGAAPAMVVTKVAGMKQTLFIEAGFGADQVGLDATTAAARACRNAIEFNSIPAIREVMSEGYTDMLIKVAVCLPGQFLPEVDVDALKDIFPYGKVEITLQEGGALFLSGQRVKDGEEALDWMLVAVAHVVVGIAED